MSEEMAEQSPSDLLKCLAVASDEVFKIALYEAQRIYHFWIGVEHVFMGLTKQSGGLTLRLLEHLGIEPKDLRGYIRGMAGIGDQQIKLEGMVITPRLTEVLKKAMAEARKQGKKIISPDHLLIAILEEGESIPVKVLHKMGVDLTQLLQLVRKGEKLPETEVEKVLSPAPETVWRHQKDKISKPAGRGSTPTLDRYSRNLTRLAREGKLRPVIGRKEILRQITRILTQRGSNNPLLVGEAGVGKTAIVEGFAYRLAREKVIPQLQEKRVMELQVSSLVSGTKHRGDLEERISRILKEVQTASELIVFIDEIHTITGGGIGNATEIADHLKPALSRGEFPCIGSTTLAEYQKHIEKDAALTRRFEKIDVEEPDLETCKEILLGVQKDLEEHHEAKIHPSGLEAAVELSARYMPQEKLPAKAIQLLEKACSLVKIDTISHREESEKTDQFLIVTEEVIRKVLSEKTGIPLARLTGDEQKRLKDMAKILKERIIGQDEAVEEVVKSIKMAKAGLKDPNRPIGVFLFMGLTGVGKTELARALAAFLFGSEDQMVRLDMSEYMEKHQVSRLIGAPPGYVGHEEEGQLTGKLRLKPYSVVLLDEIEKAHGEVQNLFLQVFDAGRLTDSKGRTVDTRDALFIMTSNLGARAYHKHVVGFRKDQDTEELFQEVDEEIKKEFSPEFLGRLDKVIHFYPLGGEEIKKILRLQLRGLEERLALQGISLQLNEEAMEYLCQQGYQPAEGARLLHRTVERELVQPLSEGILEEKYSSGDQIIVESDEGGLTFRKEEDH